MLLHLLGDDGRCDPGIDMIARLAGFGRSAVIEGLARLRRLGFLAWTRRLVRDAATGWRAEQTSNAYALRVPGPAAVACEFGKQPGVVLRLFKKEVAQEQGAAWQTQCEAAGLPDLLALRRAAFGRGE